MEIIVEYDKAVESYLRQYAKQVKSLGYNYQLLEIEERYRSWINDVARKTESNFMIKLPQYEEQAEEEVLDNAPMIVATIGTKQHSPRVDAYYNLITHEFTSITMQGNKQRGLWVSCYSEKGEMTAADYIQCINFLKHLTLQLYRPMLIYARIAIQGEAYGQGSLTKQIINTYLEDSNMGLVIQGETENTTNNSSLLDDNDISRQPYSFTFNGNLQDLLRQGKSVLGILIKEPKWFDKWHQHLRQMRAVYADNLFYNLIPPEEEIYMLLDIGNFKTPDYYEALGLKTIRVLGDYSILYAAKSQFDALSEVLRPELTARYRMPLLSHPYCMKNQVYQLPPHGVINENLRHRGRGVYIGLIAADDVDYTHNALRYEDGSSRIAYIWQQTRADEGYHYTQQEIHAALNSDNPAAMIPLPEGDSMSTMMLGVAGGASLAEGYSGVASEAEFIIARMRPASETLQRIFGGMPSPYAVTLPDIMIGILKLVEFASARGVPLVLCMPFNTNLDPHDGSLILYEILGLMSRRAGFTLVIPAGDEADKNHHYSGEELADALMPVSIRVTRPNQNVSGVIYQRVGNILTRFLYPPANVPAAPIDLGQQSVIQAGGATVYTNGIKMDFLNGTRRILFRIENPGVGEWRLQGDRVTGQLSPIKLWIAQQEINPYITVHPASSFVTIGSSSAINYVMSVGAYNQASGVVLSQSGRGYTWDNRIRPHLVTYGSDIIAPCGRGEWISITGTLPAAGIMSGAAATIYSRFIAENRMPLPNTLIMNNMIYEVLQQFPDVGYPNPSQGYGYFDLSLLNTLLAMPL